MIRVTSPIANKDSHGRAELEPTGSSPTTFLSIISDSHLLCEGLRALIATTRRLELVGSYDGATPLIESLPNPPHHLVLIHGALGRARLAELIQAWRRRTPVARILVIELCNDVELILDCIEWGAVGYTLTGDSFATLVEVIDESCCGRARCAPEVTAQLFARLSSHAVTGVGAGHAADPLTPREREILGYIACNYSNRQIAEALVIELRTVKHHVHNILDKLKLQRRWDAARLAVERGWLPKRPGEV
jgi:DNA-binding NarL/FixJ family response regulator